MKKWIGLVLVASMGINMAAWANEGMWLPFLIKRLNERDMQKMGLQLTAEELYSINNSSLKDAIINFGNFCTGEVISPKGLVLTNHHCGYDAIQSHSTPENDLLTDGFWAKNYGQELANPGLSATFLLRMDDVTERVLAAVTPEMTETDRSTAIREVMKEIIDENDGEEGEYKVEVKPFFGGNEYYMFVYEVYTDVRLVGTPPEAIGKFGGDTDNWMWPRHTGDFSMFRIYGGPDGKPADYAEENMPIKPKHYLPVNITGVKDGDFSMIFGYPGSTDRYLTSYGIDHALSVKNQTIVDIRNEKLNVMRKHMDVDPAVRLQYASKFARVANYWKYFIGQSEQLVNNKVKAQKTAQEDSFREWMNANPAHAEKYGKAFDLIASGYEVLTRTEIARTYFVEGAVQGSEALVSTLPYMMQLRGLLESNPEGADEMIAELRGGLDVFFKDYNRALDLEMLATTIGMYYHNVDADQLPESIKEVGAKYKGDFTKWATKAFDKSIFDTREELEAFLDAPSAKVLDKDPLVALMSDIYGYYLSSISPERRVAGMDLDAGNRLYIAGLREQNPNAKWYPDANFTMRMTYGKVGDYKARDAVHYDYYTTIEGIMEKEDPNNPEFVVPERLKTIYETKDYGSYANEDGEMVICFITDNDITGGNSGSPVINARGELIGTAFDGNWEAMSGDIAFDHRLQRTIVTDIRYVLLVIDKLGGAQNLIDELTLVNTTVQSTEEEEEAPVIEEAVNN